jgi:hypothetical protein
MLADEPVERERKGTCRSADRVAERRDLPDLRHARSDVSIA